MTKTRLYLATGMLLLLSIIGLVSYFLLKPMITEKSGYIYELRNGTSKKLFINQLMQLGVIKHPIIYKLYVSLHPADQLKTGEYQFPYGASFVSMWKQVISGTGLLNHAFKIIPGWSFAQLRQALQQTDTLRHVVATMDDHGIMALLGHPEMLPEGEFFPETYYYTKDSPDLTILKRAFDLMQLKLAEAWEHHAANLPYKNKYDALIVASLVEKEAFRGNERPIIAGVIINRLKKEMLLQIDPTIIYGLGAHYDGRIHKTDIHANTPYNTYVHKGLPPTPIAMPSLNSIEAAINPAIHNYYYFVAKGNGEHQFSASLIEHNRAVANTMIAKQESSICILHDSTMIELSTVSENGSELCVRTKPSLLSNVVFRCQSVIFMQIFKQLARTLFLPAPQEINGSQTALRTHMSMNITHNDWVKP